jgi:hypothetical protein
MCFVFCRLFFVTGFFWIFYVLYSTLLHLPPLRLHCVGGCWDRTQDCCDLAVRRFNHSARSHPHSARSHPHSARSYPHSARSYPHSARSHPHSARSYPHSARSYPHSARSHPHSARSHPQTRLDLFAPSLPSHNNSVWILYLSSLYS